MAWCDRSNKAYHDHKNPTYTDSPDSELCIHCTSDKRRKSHKWLNDNIRDEELMISGLDMKTHLRLNQILNFNSQYLHSAL